VSPWIWRADGALAGWVSCTDGARLANAMTPSIVSGSGMCAVIDRLTDEGPYPTSERASFGERITSGQSPR
jgi:hypothetical protein